MVVYLTAAAKKELDCLPADMKSAFAKHIEKIQKMPPRRHLLRRLPYFVEKVTKQARIVYQLDGEDILVTHCFSLHKDYERWYMSYK